MVVHKPVLVREVLEYLQPKPGENFIDATVGEAGHSLEILDRTRPDGQLLGIDLDSDQVENSRRILAHEKSRVILVNDSYANIKEILERIGFKSVQGILLDVGMSSWQLEQST